MSERTCKECGRQLIAHRKDAQFCGVNCKNRWHNKHPSGHGTTHKRLDGASGPAGRSRRRSRDGLGTRVYLTAEEIAQLRPLVAQHLPWPFWPAQLAPKLERAAERIGRKGG